MPKVEKITSAANPLLKDVRRAIARGGLTDQGWCVAETFHLLDEALRSRCAVKAVLAAESVELRGLLNGVKVTRLPDALFRDLSSTETSQGVITLVEPPAWTFDQLFAGRPLVMVLDRVQDPGNAGAIIRAAEAFGATGALFLKGSVSPFNPKTLRASAGSLFRLPFLHSVDPDVALQKPLDLYAAVPARPGAPARLPSDVDFAAACGLIIGSEAHGVDARLRSAASDVSIPTVGVESLNAAVAAGVLLYEARRQRALRP